MVNKLETESALSASCSMLFEDSIIGRQGGKVAVRWKQRMSTTVITRPHDTAACLTGKIPSRPAHSWVTATTSNKKSSSLLAAHAAHIPMPHRDPAAATPIPAVEPVEQAVRKSTLGRLFIHVAHERPCKCTDEPTKQRTQNVTHRQRHCDQKETIASNKKQPKRRRTT